MNSRRVEPSPELATRVIEAFRRWADSPPDSAEHDAAYDEAGTASIIYQRHAKRYPIVLTRGRYLLWEDDVTPGVYERDLLIDTEERRVSYRMTRRRPQVPPEALLDWSDMPGGDDD